MAEPSTSAASAHATAFVAAHRDAAVALGESAAELVHDPDAVVDELRRGFDRLADPAYRAGQQHVAPGMGATLGLRSPLLEGCARAFLRATRGVSSTVLLFLADRLLRHDLLELRWFAFHVLDRTVLAEPERSWQLLRRAAGDATDWVTVDSLAAPMARGILGEPYRWAEIEQLTFSPHPWERRLVGSVIAVMPFVDRDRGRDQRYVQRALDLLASLIGDDATDVQKALAWAYRSVATVDRSAVASALRRETEHAVAGNDGHRAWVIRDVLPKLDAATQADLRARLDGVRRRPGVPSTSTAAETARQFHDAGLGRRPDEPPLT